MPYLPRQPCLGYRLTRQYRFAGYIQPQAENEFGSYTLPEVESAVKPHTRVGWEGLKVLLNVLKESSDALAPLKATVGGIVAIIKVYDVRVKLINHSQI